MNPELPPEAVIVRVPLLVQLAAVEVADTEMVTPAQGLPGPGEGAGLLFEQEIKFAENKTATIAMQAKSNFLDIKYNLRLNSLLHLNKNKKQWLELNQHFLLTSFMKRKSIKEGCLLSFIISQKGKI